MSVLTAIRRYLAEKRSGLALPADRVREIIDRHDAGEWFFYAFSGRAGRWHVCEPSLWVQRHLPKESAIFETGCGCGLNLIWFARKGFTSLAGSDISANAISAGCELASLARVRLDLWQDDALAPARVPDRVDVVLALNWTYHVESFDLGRFLLRHSEILPQRGHLIVDLIDSSYNDVCGNQYLTSDRDKPVPERAPTEYKHRHSAAEVHELAARAGFEVRRTVGRGGESVPRVVYILRKL